MKKLSVEATQIFITIYNLLDGKEHLIINNAEGIFMALHVEKVGTAKMGEVVLEKISFAHYYKQNGDFCADPEMIFLFNVNLELVIPCYFLQANVLEEESVVFDENGVVTKWREEMQVGEVEFAECWLKNIKEQQDL